MKATALCTLLLATFTLVSGDGGAFSVTNTATIPAILYVEYRWEGGNSSQELTIPTGESKTAAIPENITHVDALVLFKRPSGLKRLFAVVSSKPVEGCLKTNGTADNLKIAQVALASADSRSMTVFNNGTFHAKVYVAQQLSKDVSTAETISVTDSDTVTIMIPEGSTEAETDVQYYPVDPAVKAPGLHDNTTKLFEGDISGHECYTLSGSFTEPQYAKIDCQGLISRDVSSCSS